METRIVRIALLSGAVLVTVLAAFLTFRGASVGRRTISSGANTTAATERERTESQGTGAREAARSHAGGTKLLPSPKPGSKLQAHLVNLVKSQSVAEPATERRLPEMDMTDDLAPRLPWNGPWPDGLADLPKTAVVRMQLARFPFPEQLDQKLAFFGRLRRCVDQRAGSRGGAFVELWFKVDPSTGEARASRADVLQSTLSRNDDVLFMSCAETAFAGTHFQVTKEVPGEAWPTEWVWRTVVNVPVKDDPLYPDLFGETSQADPSWSNTD
jgi:hypothetical protein